MATKKSRNKRNTQSDPTLDDLFAMLGGLSKRALMYIGALIVLLVLGVLLFMFFSRTSSISLDDEGELTLSPTQIKSMENIGEWEFLSISNEEIVDTVRHGFFGDNELAALYRKAYRAMLARCMTKKNIESAEQNASAQFYQLLRSMGFENIRIRFEK